MGDPIEYSLPLCLFRRSREEDPGMEETKKNRGAIAAPQEEVLGEDSYSSMFNCRINKRADYLSGAGEFWVPAMISDASMESCFFAPEARRISLNHLSLIFASMPLSFNALRPLLKRSRV